MTSIPQYIFQADIYKYGDETHKPIKRVSILAASILHATNILDELVYGNEMFEYPVEIGGITKNYEIGKIENGYLSDVDDESELEDDGEEDEQEKLRNAKEATKQILYLSKKATKNELFSFKCICGQSLTLGKSLSWEYMACPHCENIIERNDLEEIGGIWLYTKLRKNNKDENDNGNLKSNK